MENIWKISLFVSILVFLSLILGFAMGNIYQVYTPDYLSISEGEKTLDGCWAKTKIDNEWNDWICVNINDMSFDRALEVCKHETFHEIWAECGETNDLEYCINKYNGEVK